jgi:hypothetical protein
MSAVGGRVRLLIMLCVGVALTSACVKPPLVRAVPSVPPQPSAPGGDGDRRAEVVLGVLEVKGRAPKTGYSRAEFGAPWTDVDHNGCDTRNDILRRDLQSVTLKSDTSACVVVSGTLDDPYTRQAITFVRGARSADVQIDHVVALGDAWQKGAQSWLPDKRMQFGNDPLNLLAVSGQSNQQKSDGDAATWLPRNKRYRCKYVARQIAVKAAYGVWVTSAERDAMRRVLAACPTEVLPAATS